jgi:hypothetical protein
MIDADRCPHCGSTEISAIVFGYPSPELRDRYRDENVVFGGCRCNGDARDPKWMCRACCLRFGQVIQLLPDLTHLLGPD